jgi:hypothetical protein
LREDLTPHPISHKMKCRYINAWLPGQPGLIIRVYFVSVIV